MSWFTDVVRFHHKFGQRIGAGFDSKVLRWRRKLINEEFNEVCQAIRHLERLNQRRPGFVQYDEAKRELCAELVDLAYVVVGTFVELGIDPTPIWSDIHAANMRKEVNPEGGKPIKPREWRKPRIVLRSFAGVIPLIVGSSRSRRDTSFGHPLDRTAVVHAPTPVDAISKQSVPKPNVPSPLPEHQCGKRCEYGCSGGTT